MLILYSIFISILTIHCTKTDISPTLFTLDPTTGNVIINCGPNGSEANYSEFKEATLDGRYKGVLRFQNCPISFLATLRSYFSEWSLKVDAVEAANLGWKTLNSDSFLNYSGLKKLIVDHNELQTLPDGIFAHINLNYLDLSYNQIQKIESITKAGVKDLKTLLISHNNVVTIDEATFKRFNHLKILDLSFNNLATIGDGTFDLVSKLKNLSMAHNRLAHLDFGIFTHLTVLESLDISNNHLQYVDARIHLPVFRHLHQINMESNEIGDAYGLELATFPQLNHLNVRNNSFACVRLQEILFSFDLKKMKLEMDSSKKVKPGFAVRGVACERTIF